MVAADRPVRRVVTGHDAGGRSIVIEDGPPSLKYRRGPGGALFHDLWSTSTSPAPIAATEEGPRGPVPPVPPTAGGTVIRIVDFPTASDSDGRATITHRTETVDYGLVLDGEIVLLLDESEVVLQAGDVVVQRGTDHAWLNRGRTPARVAFVLVDGRFETTVADVLGSEALGRVMARQSPPGQAAGPAGGER